ncbi:hypothetical protein N0V91_009876 [Didymella pomorum]|uniref:Flavin-containing monooxygenase n=1 Tax=Didymella pomorum TaxID=749634 RepID=A0A9W8Z664_9PLEO|nr:hypothetical protein N0V91_009876 [Didymella pomorum]
MATVTYHEHAPASRVDLVDVKSKVVVDNVELEASPTPPVADDFMYDFKFNHPLPTPQSLGINIPAGCDSQQAAESIVSHLSKAMIAGDATAFGELFLEFDKLSFTWDYRTFNFRPTIVAAAGDIFPTTKVSNFGFLNPAPKISQPFPDFEQLQFVISFETDVVNASAVVTSVYTKEGWKIYALHTVAESLKQFPEVPPYDGHMTEAISWERKRKLETDAADPEILIIGGGQNGLALSARCKALGMNNLIIERSEEIGDVWSKRYEYLSLHMPHWADDLPYFTYPKHWPTYTPAQKQGLYMKWYASALELNVWRKSSVTRAEQDAAGNWTVQINKEGKEVRTLHPKQLVMATSLCGVPLSPVIPGMNDFKGTLRHSSEHDSAREWAGKKVCVVGTSSSGLDTAYDFARHGVNVTLLQRSPTYVMSLTHSVPRGIGSYAPNAKGDRADHEELDRLFFAIPTGPGEELARRNAKELEDLDKDLLDGLNAKGFRTWRGQRNTGNHTLSLTRNGGFYFEAGACKQIIDGKIKMEQGFIEQFTEDKVILNGGHKHEFDLVVFATGFSNTIDSIRMTLGEEIAQKCGPIWGIDEEGEYKTAFKETGVPNMWIMCGFLVATRYHSKLLALRLKALAEGVALPPYKKRL